MAILTGRGAWTVVGKDSGLRQYQYTAGLPLDGSTPAKSSAHYSVWCAVKAIQDQINSQNLASGLLVEDGVLGPKSGQAIREAQTTLGLKSDGIAGPGFCTKLWRPLIQKAATESGIDPKYLFAEMLLESGADDGAQGYMHEPDRGLVQINLEVYTALTADQAHDPKFALPWAAKRIRAAFDKYSGKGSDLQVKCAILQHNTVTAADYLYRTGKYPSAVSQAYVEKTLSLTEDW